MTKVKAENQGKLFLNLFSESTLAEFTGGQSNTDQLHLLF